MRIRSLYLAIEGDDYLTPNPPGSDFPFSVSHIVSDFDFQTGSFLNYFDRVLKKSKFQSEEFQFVTIRGRKKPSNKYLIKKHFKSLEVEIPFDEKKYKELYPFKNKYPIKGLLSPILKEEEFNIFLFEMIMEGLLKSKKQEAPIPYDFLIETLSNFKLGGFNNEWIHKKKICKDYGVIAYLKCRLTSNYFSLELIIEKSKKEIYKKEVLRTLPNVIMYKDEFKDIQVVEGKLLIMKNTSEESILFSLDLSSL